MSRLIPYKINSIIQSRHSSYQNASPRTNRIPHKHKTSALARQRQRIQSLTATPTQPAMPRDFPCMPALCTHHMYLEIAQHPSAAQPHPDHSLSAQLFRQTRTAPRSSETRRLQRRRNDLRYISSCSPRRRKCAVTLSGYYCYYRTVLRHLAALAWLGCDVSRVALRFFFCFFSYVVCGPSPVSFSLAVLRACSRSYGAVHCYYWASGCMFCYALAHKTLVLTFLPPRAPVLADLVCYLFGFLSPIAIQPGGMRLSSARVAVAGELRRAYRAASPSEDKLVALPSHEHVGLFDASDCGVACATRSHGRLEQIYLLWRVSFWRPVTCSRGGLVCLVPSLCQTILPPSLTSRITRREDAFLWPFCALIFAVWGVPRGTALRHDLGMDASMGRSIAEAFSAYGCSVT